MVSSLVCTWTHRALPASKTLLGAWLCHHIQSSHVVGLDGVEAGDGRQPIDVDDLMVSHKGAAAEGYSEGEFAMSHWPLVSWVDDLAMASDERVYWPHM